VIELLFPTAFPDHHLLVGLEDDADGSLRVYVDARYLGIHTHVDDEAAKEEVRRGYASAHHVTAHIPRDSLCDCPPSVEAIS
jgi:hypothetical protein